MLFLLDGGKEKSRTEEKLENISLEESGYASSDNSSWYAGKRKHEPRTIVDTLESPIGYRPGESVKKGY